MNIYLILITSAVYSYLLGGLNGAIILSKILYGKDIRDYGSHNPGFTNFRRVFGNSFTAWSVILIDFVKTAIPVFITSLLMHNNFGLWQLGAAFSGFFCMLGHCFPVWYRFHGGKAFMAGFATIWFVDWRMALIATAVFVILLLTTHYMSLSACCASLACPIALLILGPTGVWVEILCALSALLVILRHHENIGRLIKGTESKFYLKKK